MPNLVDFYKGIFLHVIPVRSMLSQLKVIRKKIAVFKTVLKSVDLLQHALPEATGGIDGKVIEETTDQNLSNTKYFTTNTAPISMTPPFYYYRLAFWGIFDVFHDVISGYLGQWS